MTVRKNRIGLFLSPRPTDGGAYQYALAMAKSLASWDKREFDMTVLALDSSWVDVCHEFGLKCRVAQASLLARVTWRFWQKARLPVALFRRISQWLGGYFSALPRSGCDLWIFASQDLASFATPVRSVAPIHDLMHRIYATFPEVAEPGEYRRREFLYGNMCKWLDGILVDSKIGREHAESFYDCAGEKVLVQPFCPPSYVEEATSAKGSIRLLNLPQKYLFYPAQFWKHKNHVGLLEALTLVREKNPDVHVVFSGSAKNAGSEVAHFIATNKLESNVTSLGYVSNDEVVALYKGATALVMPTYFGPTNIPPLEAFALGCPVAISNLFGMPEQAADAALLFDPSSSVDIARCIETLWTNDEKRRELAVKGLARAKALSLDAFSKTLEGHVRTLLAKWPS